MKRFVRHAAVLFFVIAFENVIVVAEGGYSFVQQWDTASTGIEGFAPYGIAKDADGKIYVADTVNCCIHKFDSDGVKITDWGGFGLGDGHFDDGPYAVAIGSSGDAYVADHRKSCVQLFRSLDGILYQYVATFRRSSGEPVSLSDPAGIGIGPGGCVYVGEHLGHRVQKFSASGVLEGPLNLNGMQLSRPTGVAADSLGYVYVADSFNSRIVKFDGAGTAIGWFGGCDAAPGNGLHPVDGKGHWHPSNSGHNAQPGTGDGQFDHPGGIAVDSANYVYVADNWNSRVQKLTGEGQYVTSFGQYGSAEGQFNCPAGIVVDSEGCLYVTDWYHNRVQKFAPGATTVLLDIKPGSCPNPLNVKDTGVLPVAILGTANFDVTAIDAASVRLEGVAPIRSALEDVATPVAAGVPECACTSAGPDGYLDLTLKFDAQAIVAALGSVSDGAEVRLTLTGALLGSHGGGLIEGADCVVILSKGNKK